MMLESSIIGWGLLISAGALSGFCSGLLGLGGGFVIVPALIVALPMIGVASPDLVKIAMATSLALVVPTQMASAQAHYIRGTLNFQLWGLMLPSVVAGALIIPMVSQHINSSLALVTYVVFVVVLSWQILVQPLAVDQQMTRLTPSKLASISVKGFGGGALSALLGMGISWVAVPVLSRFTSTTAAIGTASALAIPLGTAGVAGYLQAPQPAGCEACVGYVHLLVIGPIGVVAVLMAPIGAQVGQHLPVLRLKQLFAISLTASALALMWKKLPEIKAEAQMALIDPVLACVGDRAPASAPTWLQPGQLSGAQTPQVTGGGAVARR